MLLPDHLREAIHHYVPQLEGWTEPDRACRMAELIIREKPDVVVELGVFGARTLIAQAFALRDNHRGKIYGIDPWKLAAALEGENADNQNWWSKNIDIEVIQQGAIKAVWDHNLDEWAVVIRASSQFVHQLFPAIDVLFVDANHSEVASLRDVELYAPRVKKGGWIWMDDCNWPTTEKARTRMLDFADKVEDDGKFQLYKKR